MKIFGATIGALGFLFLFGGVLAQIVYHARVLIEVLGYIASVALIGAGYWVGPEYLTWTVFFGCILFAGTVFATLWIHEIKGDDPKPLAALFMVVWGAVAVYYSMTEVGFLAIMALMTVLGFSIVVTQLTYSFGFEKESMIPQATMTALILLAAFVVIHIWVPNAPAALAVFKPGAFWVASFVSFTGLLIMASRYYSKESQYFMMQIVTVIVYAAALSIALIANINPLAGMAGTFLVFYLAEKLTDVPVEGAVGMGVRLILIGGLLYGAWWYASSHGDMVQQFLTAQL